MTSTCPATDSCASGVIAWGPLTLFILAAHLMSCTALLLEAPNQCNTDSDCQFLGAGFDCSTEHVCVQQTAACATSQHCIDAMAGAPAACIEETCVLLTNASCQEIIPADAVGNDNTIFVGWMGPLTGSFSSIGIPIKQAAQLAIEEIDQFSNGLPGGLDERRRKLAIIACHDLDDPIGVARHLAETVKVPAIIGPAFSGVALDVATDVTVVAGTLLLSPSATSPALTDLDDRNLVWRTAPSDSFQAIPLAFLVSQLEAKIRTSHGLTSNDDVRVAAATKGDAYGQGLIASLADLMLFNGRNVADNASANAFQSEQYPDPADNLVDFTPFVQSIIAFQAHLVLPLGTNEGITEIMNGVEAGWAPTAPPARPLYLFADGGRLTELLHATTSNDDLRRRVRGTVPGRPGDNYQSFALRFEQRFGQAPGTFADNAYDAAYLLAYAIVGSGKETPRGVDIADALTQMTRGETIVAAGPSNLNAGFETVGKGSAINFDGASGPLDFDPKTGEAASDIDIWCIDLDSNNNAFFLSSGQYYDAVQDAVMGADTCGGI